MSKVLCLPNFNPTIRCLKKRLLCSEIGWWLSQSLKLRVLYSKFWKNCELTLSRNSKTRIAFLPWLLASSMPWRHLKSYPSVYFSVCSCLPVYMPVCFPSCLPVCLSAFLSFCLSACLPVCPPAYLTACLTVCLSVRLSVWLSRSVDRYSIPRLTSRSSSGILSTLKSDSRFSLL
jgi:hypothetical protein